MATTNEYPQLLEIDTGAPASVTIFTANGEYIVGGTGKDVRVWRAKDGKHVAAMPVKGSVNRVAASNDGRWIAAGMIRGDSVLVWDATTYKQVFVDGTGYSISDVDFSPDSTRLVSAIDGDAHAAIIWDFAAGQKVQTLDHGGMVKAARYSPQGNRIATASEKSIRVWDSNDGRLLFNVDVRVRGWYGLLWCDNHLFVQTRDSKIKQINAMTGSTVLEWPVLNVDKWSCIALPQRGKFIAHSVKNTITFWDAATHSRFSPIRHTHEIFSLACSPDDQLLAFVAAGSKIIVKKLIRSVSEPELDIDSTALNAWKRGQLTNAEALLSAAIPTSKNGHHVLASRALVRARLGQWDAALVDAKQSIKIQRSVIGYIAKCVALVGKGEKDSGCRLCDIASLRFPSYHISLLLIKAVVLFIAGEHVDAISRMDDLITDSTDLWADPALYVVQAYMHLLLRNKQMESSDYESAIQSFEDARIQLRNLTRQPPLIVSLISGWSFDDFAITIQQRLCEAFLAAGRTKEAGETILHIMDQEINITEPIKTWVSDFKCRCCSKLEDLGDGAMNTSQYDEAISQYTTALSLDPAGPQDLLMKRSNAWVSKGAQEDAVNDAKEWARLLLMFGSWKDALAAAAAVGFMLERFVIYRAVCERLEMAGRVTDAVACFHQIASELTQEINEEQANWTRDFKSRCHGKLEDLGDSAVNAKQYDEAVSQYTAALSLNPATPQDLLMKRSNAWVGKSAREDALNDAQEWVTLMLMSGSWKDALTAAVAFMLERFTIYQAVCEHLETAGHVTDAVSCFCQMSGELAQEIDAEQANWTLDFKSRCSRKLEDLGDTAAIARQYDEAVTQYTAALSVDPPSSQQLLLKRSKVHADEGNWRDALNDANEAIKLDSSSPLGYERKYAVLCGMGYHDDAIDAFDTMVSKMPNSSNLDISMQSRRSVRPEQTKEAIRASIQNAICDSPLVLINALSGRLCNKAEQAAAFESTPAFMTLIASMTTHIDHALIEQVVGEFYRYATFSHTWEGNEPLYEKVVKIVVYDLEASPTHEKLQIFCKIARDEGFNWAWSDTCCIDKGDHFVLQEALVSMFKWYDGSAMTIIFLCDVDRLAELGALTMSRWNSRGWTLQEYHASKVVRIYTKDWTPYLGLTIYNHKESPEIILEMEKATGISAQAFMTLRPGLNDIQHKLRLASTRQTTRVEDAAYSLLGIFSMTLPVTYGEGDKALGRLLSQLLTSSGDMSILAWTGKSGSFNSCLPTSIVVFSEPLSTHIPPAIPDAEMETITAGLHALPLDLDLLTRLYDRVDELPTPTFAAQRMRLPCLAFKIRLVSRRRDESEFVFCAQAGALGTVEIKTKQNFTLQDSLYLVHPWIDFLLDRRAAGKRIEIIPHENETSELDEFLSFDSFRDLSSTSHGDPLDSASLPSPSTVLPNTQLHFYQFLARLRQSFGALLFASNPWNVAEYRRVATENPITAQVEEISSATLDRLIQGVRVLDVL